MTRIPVQLYSPPLPPPHLGRATSIGSLLALRVMDMDRPLLTGRLGGNPQNKRVGVGHTADRIRWLGKQSSYITVFTMAQVALRRQSGPLTKGSARGGGEGGEGGEESPGGRACEMIRESGDNALG